MRDRHCGIHIVNQRKRPVARDAESEAGGGHRRCRDFDCTFSLVIQKQLDKHCVLV